MHAQHISGPVGLAADAAGVGEAVNVGLHVLLELALVVSELAAHSAGPHPVGLNEDVLNLLIQLRIDLDKVLRHILVLLPRHIITRCLMPCLLNFRQVLIFRRNWLQVSTVRRLELGHVPQTPGVLGQPSDLELPGGGEELGELRLGDLDLA